MTVPADDRLSASNTKAGRLQRALLNASASTVDEGTIPTSGRFLFYELVTDGIEDLATSGGARPRRFLG